MTIPERFIWRTAHALVEDFCDAALPHAEGRADACLDEGDLAGYRTWVRVLDAIKEIRGVSLTSAPRLN